MKQQFILISEYNQWMNESLLSHLNEVIEPDIYEEKGAFWGSAFKTMSHVFTCDLMWLHRFTNVQSSYDLAESLSEFPHPTSNSTHCCVFRWIWPPVPAESGHQFFSLFSHSIFTSLVRIAPVFLYVIYQTHRLMTVIWLKMWGWGAKEKVMMRMVITGQISHF